MASMLGLLASISAVPAHALGLGEAVLISRIGEPLHAEIQLIASPDESPGQLCYSLGTPPDGDLPTLRHAKLRVVQRNQDYRLLILGQKPLFEPIIALSLRANCGADLQRDYILAPEGPASGEQIDTPRTAPTAPASIPEKRSKRRPRPVEVDNPAPEIPSLQLDPRHKAKPRPKNPPADRLVLGTPSEVTSPPSADTLALVELEERMLRMETSLHHLHNDLVHGDEQLALAARAEKRPASPPPTPLKAHAAIAPAAHWQAFLLSSLIGGLLSLAALVLYERRRQPPERD